MYIVVGLSNNYTHAQMLDHTNRLSSVVYTKLWPSIAKKVRRMPAVAAAVKGTEDGEEEQRLRRDRREKMRQLQQDLDPRLDYEVRLSRYSSVKSGYARLSSHVGLKLRRCCRYRHKIDFNTGLPAYSDTAYGDILLTVTVLGSKF